MTDTFRTLLQPSTSLFKDKGSKFLSFAYPVSSEEEIKKILSDLRKEYHDARHVCFAWVLNPDGSHFRSSDDGEPSGTAGKPILGQIQSNKLTQILIVVVRYFGGTLLGTAGLVIAYRTAAMDAIAQGQIIEKNEEDRVRLFFPYESMNSIMKIMKENQLDPSLESFETECLIEVNVRKSLTALIKKKIMILEKVRIEISDNNS